jgi:phosphatidylserine/phosphatidylglycerophosphate/cardiolipin synthase-like enzyme
MADKQTLQDFLTASFEDQRLSRNEASVFRDLVEDWNPTPNDMAWLRNRIFTLASESMKDSRDQAVLEWVESLFKAMSAQKNEARIEEEALFYPSQHALDRLLAMLNKTTQTMDICVFTITDNRISRAIESAHNRGVQVRIITDDEKALDLGSDVVDLNQAGIPVRFDNSPHHMHNKFALLDRRLFINGSFNWTRSASLNNRENIVVSNSPYLLQRFQQEFDQLWKQFGND